MTYIHKHATQNVAMLDNECTHDMSSNITMFKFKGKNTPVMKLGDDNTMLCIKGYGYMDYTIIGGKVRHMSYCIPNLGTTLISVRQHIKY